MFSRFTDFPPLRTAQLLERFFSIAEIVEYQKFKIPKRQFEWLASRLLVKHLVQRVFSPDSTLPMKSITVRKECTGVPYVVIEGLGRVGWLSISHSHDGVLAAFSQDGKSRFGVDLEFIEPRSLNLFADYFTAAEIAWLSTLDEKEKDICSNLVWSAKEAFLKAIEKGLQLDTRIINIHPTGECLLPKGWNTMVFSIEGIRLQDWQLLFSLNYDFVMTFCLAESLRSQLFEVDVNPSLDY